jgi:hypothetical protein
MMKVIALPANHFLEQEMKKKSLEKPVIKQPHK